MAGFKIARPLNVDEFLANAILDGTLARFPSPQPGPLRDRTLSFKEFRTMMDAMRAADEAERKADEAEFKLLQGKITDKDVDAYVKHRTEFFGSTWNYKQFAAKSDKELADSKWLRGQVDLHGEAEKVFYRWVSKAYEVEKVKDVPALIKQRMTPKLSQALEKVKKSYNKPFATGGFNPRPMKDADYRYMLGTLSLHGTGMAIDIEDAKNPILSLAEWALIEKLTGRKVIRSLSRWEKTPKALWKDIYDLNELFKAKIAAEVNRVKPAVDAAVTATTPGADTEFACEVGGVASGKIPVFPMKALTPIEFVSNDLFAQQPKLKEWIGGFFTLEWELVEQLHANGFTWGATFPKSVDLHHFELR